jgi:hypothetical protein
VDLELLDDAKIETVTTREQIEAALDELPDSELVLVLRFIVSRGPNANDPEAAWPGDIIDDWGNLSAMTRASSARLMRRLAEEEAAAGHDPW